MESCTSDEKYMHIFKRGDEAMSSHHKEIRVGRGIDLYVFDDSYISIEENGKNISIRGAGRVFYFDTWDELIDVIARGKDGR